MFRHTEDMGEISGFGGDYEQACQNMLEAGCKWLEEKKSVNLKGHIYDNVFGLFKADSDDAKAMESAVIAACGDCSGAMHHAVMSRLFYIARNGWDKYCQEVRAKVAAKADKS